MEQKSELYAVLAAYARKNDAVFVWEDAFLSYYIRHAGSMNRSLWAQDKESKFKAAITELEAEGVCRIVKDDAGKNIIFLLQIYYDSLKNHYNSPEEFMEQPFPTDDQMEIKLPSDQVKAVAAETELMRFMESAEEDRSPAIRISFPGLFGSVLIPGDLFPEKLIEAALFKMSNFLDNNNNATYFYQRLVSKFKGKESYLKGMLDKLAEKPAVCAEHLAEGDEGAYIFWTLFCRFIKEIIKEKNSPVATEIAAAQAAYIIEAAVQCYKIASEKRQRKAQAIKELTQRLNTPPYYYTLPEITQFTTFKGVPILEILPRDELEQWLSKQSSEITDSKMPELLILYGKDKEQLFIPKGKLIIVCDKLITDLQSKVKTGIYQRWDGMLREYETEAAMEADIEFELLIRRQVDRLNSFLVSLIADPRLRLAYLEIDESKDALNAAARVFSKGVVNTYPALFRLKRKELLGEVRSQLPLRYTLPVVSAIIAFFGRMRRKKAAPAPARKGAPGRSSQAQGQPQVQAAAQGPGGEKRVVLSPAAEKAAKEAKSMSESLVPEGYTIDSYMEELKTRWIQMTDKKDQEDTVKDVNNLAKRRLNQAITTLKRRTFSMAELSEMASDVVEWNPKLSGLNGRKALKQYLELYFLKVLGTPGI